MFDFGKRLRDVRQQNGLTQKQSAEKIGSDERGVRRLTKKLHEIFCLC